MRPSHVRAATLAVKVQRARQSLTHTTQSPPTGDFIWQRDLIYAWVTNLLERTLRAVSGQQHTGEPS